MNSRGKHLWPGVVLGVLAAVVLGGIGIWLSGWPPEPASSSFVPPTEQPEATTDPASVTPVGFPVQPDEGQQVRVLFVGDSITRGAFATTPAKSFPALVARQMHARGAQVESKTMGGPGLGVDGVLADTMPAGRFDVVIVEVGTNDQPREIDGFARDYDKLLAHVRQGSPDAAMLCAGTWLADTIEAKHLDTAIESTCTEHEGAYLDLSGIFADPTNRGPAGVKWLDGNLTDDFHPNNDGHAAIADAMAQELGLFY